MEIRSYHSNRTTTQKFLFFDVKKIIVTFSPSPPGVPPEFHTAVYVRAGKTCRRFFPLKGDIDETDVDCLVMSRCRRYAG